MDKWATDELIADFIDKSLRLCLKPFQVKKTFKNFENYFKVQIVLNLHYASIFNTPINRRLQTFCISVLIYLFLAGAQTTMILLGGVLM